MYEREHIRQIEGYVPGLQPGSGAIKLNTNENPFPPSPRVMARLADVQPFMLQRYPDSIAGAFRGAAACAHGLTPDQVVATNGGDELLRLALATFSDPGRPVGIVSPGYNLYSVLAELHQAPIVDVPLTETWELPESTAACWNEAGAQLAFLTNPHAPSGTLFPTDAIASLATCFRGVLVIDEAYVDFVDPSLCYDTTRLIARHPNVLLLRTLSKGYSLAGLRLGYGLGNEELVRPILSKTKDSYNLDAIAQLLATTALDDQVHARISWEAVRRERKILSQHLQDLNFTVTPSQTNFLLAASPAYGPRVDAHELYVRLMDRRIFVRWFDAARLRDKLRITIGTSEENAALISAIEQILSEARSQ